MCIEIKKEQTENNQLSKIQINLNDERAHKNIVE